MYTCTQFSVAWQHWLYISDILWAVCNSKSFMISSRFTQTVRHTPHWRQKSLHTQITSEDLLWFTAQGSTMRILAFSMLATPSMHLLVRCIQFGSACLACALMQMHFFPLSLCTKSYIQYIHYTKLVWSKFKPRTIFPPLLRHYEP